MPINPRDNILDKAFEVFSGVQKKIGEPSPDEVSFVGGFTACFGIIIGKVDIGLDQNAPLDQILDIIHRNLHDFGRRVIENQAKQQNGNGRIS